MREKFDEAYRLFAKLVLGDQVRQGTSTTLKNALANIYTTDETCETFRYSRLTGMLTLDIDRKMKSTMFRMYAMDSFELIFECELYYGFEENYRQITQNLWAFDFLQGVIAFQFALPTDGQEIATAVKQHSHKMSQYFNLLDEKRKDEANKKKQQSFFGKIKNIFGKENVPVEKKEQTKIISVRKQNSITFNHLTGKFENIPAQFEMIFAQLGITKKDLENPATAKDLMDDLILYKTLQVASEDPSATDLRKTIKHFHLEQSDRDLQQEQENNQKLNPPLPLGIPPSLETLLPPPQMPAVKHQVAPNLVQQLMQEIRNNKIKLKAVTPNGNSTTVNMISDKDQIQDLQGFLLKKLRQRKQALRPRLDSDSDKDD